MALEIEIARKAFPLAGGGERLIFDGLSLSVADGAVIALLGPSGCGKSTLLRIVAGLDRAYTGVVKNAASTIGMAFQEPRLLPWRTIADNLKLAAPALTDAGMREWLAAFELAGHEGDVPGQLSLGLARRAALARAFAVGPDLLLLDEPFASLDCALQRRLRNRLAALFDARKRTANGSTPRKITALIATHDIDDALLLADEVIFLGSAPARILGRLPIAAPRGTRDEDLTNLRRLAARFQVIGGPGNGRSNQA